MTTPQDLAAAYRGARQRIQDLCSGLTPEQEAMTVTLCPDWSVRDLIAHLCVIAAEPVAGNIPGDDLDAWMADGMAKRADRSSAEMLAEWAEASPAFEGIIEAIGEPLRTVVYDVGAHEHDLRHTLDLPGARDADVVQIGLEAELDRLDNLAREQDRGSVRISVTDTGATRVCGNGDGDVALALDRFELFRLLGNRRSRAQVLAAPWIGDVEPLLPVLEVEPFPTADVDE